MTIPLVIDGTTYNYPQRNDRAWGQEATDWAEAITDKVNGIAVSGDIAPTTFIAATGAITAATNVTGILLNGSELRSIVIDYNVYRVTMGPGAEELTEQGMLFCSYKSTAGTWSMGRQSFNDASGVTFTITNLGQLQYTQTAIGGTGESCVMKFRGRAT